MSQKNKCYDNAVAESFFSLLKKERSFQLYRRGSYLEFNL